MINCHLVHGFNVSDGGKNTTDKLIPFLNRIGLKLVQHDYGHFGIRDVLRKNKNVAQRIKDAICSHRGLDIGIGHSNGCAILVKAAENGAKFEKLILINPALDKNYKFPKCIKEIHVFHNPHDKPVVLAKWLRKFAFWRNNFLWGEMGNKGYTGNDTRVTSHKYFKGHSAAFKAQNKIEFESQLKHILDKKA